MKRHHLVNIFAIIVILVCCFGTGFSTGAIIAAVPQLVEQFKPGTELPEVGLAVPNILSDAGNSGGVSRSNDRIRFDPFWEAWDIVHEYYVDQPLDDNSLMEGAIRGMLESLDDQHTRYSDPESFQKESDISGEEYEGIGAWVDISGDYVKITSPMKGSPAEGAGLRAKDLVIAIDGEDMTDVDTEIALDKILGQKGTTVVLTIKRGDLEPFDVSIVRAAVVTPMVISEMREDGIAYVQLTQFGDLTVEELQRTLKEVLPQKPKGLILDLRNNGGGYVETCVSVASEFLPKNSLVLIEREGDGRELEYRTRGKPSISADLPIVVLGNEGTASASEILIGALQYYERAVFVGVQTYGKGSMQIQPELSNGGAVSVTIARWLTPAGELIHGIGITPDVVVEMTEEDYANDVDPQLDKAVEIILTGELPAETDQPAPEMEATPEILDTEL